VLEIKEKIARLICLPPLMQILLMGDARMSKDFEQPLEMDDSETITLSLMERTGEPTLEDIHESLKSARGQVSVNEAVYFSRLVPEFSWMAMASLHDIARNPVDIIAAMLVRNGSEEAAAVAISRFTQLDGPCMGFWRRRSLISNKGYGGRGTYQQWL
jgi:hypothetical protein